MLRFSLNNSTEACRPHRAAIPILKCLAIIEWLHVTPAIYQSHGWSWPSVFSLAVNCFKEVLLRETSLVYSGCLCAALEGMDGTWINRSGVSERKTTSLRQIGLTPGTFLDLTTCSSAYLSYLLELGCVCYPRSWLWGPVRLMTISGLYYQSGCSWIQIQVGLVLK